MGNTRPVLFHVLPEADNETAALEKLAESLTAEIAEQDVDSFGAVEPDEIPGDAKGIGILVGWIAVHVSSRNLGRLVRSVADWAARNRRDVEIRYGDDVIIVTRVTGAQQEKLINEWLDRHRTS